MSGTRENAQLSNVGSVRLPRDVRAWEPSAIAIFAAKLLLYPLTATFTLTFCIWFSNGSMRGLYLLIAVIGFIGVAELFEAADIDHASRGAAARVRELIDIALRWGAICVFVGLLLYLSDFRAQMRDPALLMWFALTPFTMWFGKIGVSRAWQAGSQRVPPRNAIILGLTEQGLNLDRSLRSRPLLHTRSLGFFEDRALSRLPKDGRDRIRGRISDVSHFIRSYDVRVVYIALPMANHPRILNLLDELRDSPASVYFLPDLQTFRPTQARLEVIDGIPLLTVCESPFYGARGLAKRLFDIVAASTILLLTSPIFIAVAIGVALSSPGPVIFKQRRYGLDGREILVYKFRSMTVTEDGEHAYTQVTRNDNRVTRFGAFIRRASLDELPQFLNVLEGSMSVVGPRPHAIAVNEHYRRLIPSYMLRHKVKPGITGWAQVNGYRGGDDLATMSKRIEYDLQYLCSWSVSFDLRIILQTMAVVWNDRRAY